jgi:hypothetical protein
MSAKMRSEGDPLRKTEDDKVDGEFATVVRREGRVGFQLLIEAPEDVSLQEGMISPQTRDSAPSPATWTTARRARKRYDP